MSKKDFQSLLISFLLLPLFFTTSCVPTQQDKTLKGACGELFYFDSKTRSCVKRKDLPTPPKNSLTEVTLAPDQISIVDLTYKDQDSDMALACSVDGLSPSSLLTANSTCSCLGGVCSIYIKTTNFQSGIGQFYYTITDKDGTSAASLVKVTVTHIDHTPIVGTAAPYGSTLSSTFNENESATFRLYYSDVDNDKATSCQTTLGIVKTPNVGSSYNGTFANACSCESGTGICTVTISGQKEITPPDPTAYPTVREYFTYKVKAGGNWSTESGNNFYTLNFYNNLPSPLGVTPKAIPTEGFSEIELNAYYYDPDNTTAKNCFVTPISNVGVGGCNCGTPISSKTGKCIITLLNYATPVNYANSSLSSYNWGFYYNVQDSFDDQIGLASSPIYFSVTPFNQLPVLYNTPETQITLEETPLYPSPFYVDEGGISDEDSQSIRIKITSSNQSLVPNSNFTLYSYGTPLSSNDGTAWISIGDGTINPTADSSPYPISVVIKPLDNFYGLAYATVSMTDSLSNATPSVSAFSFIIQVTPVNDAPSLRPRVPYITFNKTSETTSCDDPSTRYYTENCFGNYGSNGATLSVTPDSLRPLGQIIYDYKSGLSYTFTGSRWQPFITSCPISKGTDADEPACKNSSLLNCIGDGTPSFSPSKSTSYYFDYANNVCYKSSGTAWSAVAVTTPTIYCDYDQGFSGSGNPTSLRGTPSASEHTKIFKDSVTGGCYVAVHEIPGPGINPTAYWTGFTSTCPYTKSGCKNIFGTPSNCIGPKPPQLNQLSYGSNYFDAIPTATDLYYYETSTAKCYRSVAKESASTAVNWIIYGDVIPDVKSLQKQKVSLKDFYVDEGDGNDSSTESVSLVLNKVKEYHNEIPDVLDLSTNVTFYCNGYILPPTPTLTGSSWTGMSVPLMGTNCPVSASPYDVEDSYKKIEIQFKSTNYGISELSLSATDDGTPSQTRTNYFSYIVYPLIGKSTSPFWTEVIALGNKIIANPTPNIAKTESIGVRLKWAPITIQNVTFSSDPASGIPPVDSRYNYYSTTNASVAGYSIFRRTEGTPYYDFTMPLNRTPISTDFRTYVDQDNGFATPPGPPHPGTVYYYTVRAIDSIYGLLIHGNAPEMRIIAPPDNMAFVPRSLVNYEVCKHMPNATPIASDNFKCQYSGPGETIPSNTRGGISYYDIGTDLLVDRFESGCPYGAYNGTPTPGFVSFEGNTCGNGPCYGSVTSLTGTPTRGNKFDVFYSRMSGECFVKDNANNWLTFNDALSTPNSMIATPVYPGAILRANLPPLVNISQENANLLCNMRQENYYFQDDVYNNTSKIVLPSPKIPSRKEQIAYSSWSADTTDEDIDSLETGNALNASYKCNSSSAQGLSGDFLDDTDGSTLPYAFIHSLPGRNSCEAGVNQNECIRSLITGSNKTASSNLNSPLGCLSRFGLQDTIGNVREWTDDRIYCHTDKLCLGVFGTSPIFPSPYSGIPCKFNIENDVSALDNFTCSNSLFSHPSRNDHHCIGGPVSGAPTAVSTPDGVVYYDRVNDQCYMSLSGTGWLNSNSFSSCPISSADTETGCTGLNCIFGPATDITNYTPINLGSFLLFIDFPGNPSGQCYRSYDDGNVAYVWTPVSTIFTPVPITAKPSPLNSQTDFRVDDEFYYYFAADGRTGPNDSGTGILPIKGWTLADRDHDAGKFLFPLGLPSTNYFTSNFPDSSLIPYLLDIGSSSGITSDALHNDYFAINSESIYINSITKCGALSSGGSFLSGRKGGRFNGEFYPCDVSGTPNQVMVNAQPTARANIAPDLGMRCLIRVPTPPASNFIIE